MRLRLLVAVLMLIPACASPSGGSLPAVKSPLEKIAGVSLYLDRATVLSDELQRWDEGQQTLSDCMRGLGFDYRFVAFPVISTRYYADGTVVNQQEWVETYGFGVSTMILQSEVTSHDERLVGNRRPDEISNPNLDLLASLSEIEQGAWLTAMYGRLPDFTRLEDPSVGEDEIAELEQAALDELNNEITQACFGRAVHGSERRAAVMELNSDLLDRLDLAVRADLRFVSALDEVATCLNSLGFEYDVETTIKEFERRASEILRRYQEDAFAYMVSIDPEGNFGDDKIEELLTDGSLAIDGVLAEELHDLQSSELRIAGAHFECGGMTALEEIYNEIRLDIEARFASEFSVE